MNLKNIDTILYINPEELITEEDRRQGNRSASGVDRYGYGSVDYLDPAMYSTFSFGNSLRSSLNNIGDGFTAEVTDFKKWVVVDIKHHDVVTGRTSGKTFLVVFQKKGNGIVLSTHNKWRSISGADQAASYIRSAAYSLKNDTNNKL